MKKITLIGLVISFTSLGFAQNDGKVQKNKNYISASAIHLPQSNIRSVIWQSDFSTPSDWTISNGSGNNDNWVIDTISPAGQFAINKIQSSTAANGFALFDSDLYCSGNQNAYLTTANAINCSGYPGVIVRFEQFYRRFSCETFVDVSIDNGTTWTEYPVNASLAVNQATTNPTQSSVNISAIAGGEPSVLIRFRFLSNTSNDGDGCDYAWMIDDVSVEETPANDMALENIMFKGFDSTFTAYYTRMPSYHAEADSILFAAEIRNNGSGLQHNARLEVDVTKSGSPFWSGSSNGLTLNPVQMDSVQVSTPFVPNADTGLYVFTFIAKSDSTDALPGNETKTHNFRATEITFGRDINTITSLNYYPTASASYQMGLFYETKKPDTILSISAYFPIFSDGTGLKADDPVSVYLLDTNLNVIVQREFFAVPADQEDGWVTVPVPKQFIPAGEYYASFKVYNPSENYIGTHSELNSNVPRGVSLARLDDGQWGLVSIMPYIRMYTVSNRDLCQGVTININHTSIENEVGSITTTVSGGQSPYTFSWTASNGGVVPGGQATIQNLSNINNQGTYTLIVTDAFGCSSSAYDVIIGGTVSRNSAIKNKKFKIYPNPSSDVVNLSWENTESVSTITLRNLLGQVVMSKTINIIGSHFETINLANLSKGIYIIEVSENGISVNTEKIIVK